MRLYFIKTPRIIKRIFAKYTWSFASDEPEVYLTFDDGPTPEVTEFVLATLKKYNAKATFFCIGKNIANNPEIFKKIVENGHSVGNHTYNHDNGFKTAVNDYIKSVVKTEKLIHSFMETSTIKLFRPPYGKIRNDQAKELIGKGYKVIMWDVLSADFEKEISPERCLKNVLNNVRNGSIIVFHDSLKSSKIIYNTLPKVLAELAKRGIKFKAIT